MRLKYFREDSFRKEARRIVEGCVLIPSAPIVFHFMSLFLIWETRGQKLSGYKRQILLEEICRYLNLEETEFLLMYARFEYGMSKFNLIPNPPN